MNSIDLIQRSRKVTPGGVHSQRRHTDPPLSIVRAKGAYLWDSEGRQYIDYHAAYGPIVLGHAYPEIIDRVKQAMELVDLVGIGVTPAEVELCERLVAEVPCFEQVLLCNTGSEATLHAVRLARAVTGREHVVKFQGSYHGTHDYLLNNDLAPCIRPVDSKNPDPQAGVLSYATDCTLVCRYNDLDSVRAVAAEYPGQIAAIFVEAYAHNIGGAAPEPGFLEGLRSIADEIGALLVFDEVITGIRHGLGGYQAISGVVPDLATLAKSLGNGMPIGAVGGKREWMQRYNTTELDDSAIDQATVLYSGTFNGCGGSAAAALATIEILSDGSGYRHMASLGARLREGLQTIFDEAGVVAHAGGINGIVHVFFGSGRVKNQEDVSRNDVPLYKEFRRQTLTRGVFDNSNTQAMRSCISLSHTTADIDNTLEISREALKAALQVLRR